MLSRYNALVPLHVIVFFYLLEVLLVIGKVIRSASNKHFCKGFFFTILQVFKDKGKQREILDLQVYCTYSNDGCEWTNELRHLEVCSLYHQ